MKTDRRYCYEIIYKCIFEGAYSNLEIQALEKNDVSEGLRISFIRKVVYGVIERWITLEWLYHSMVKRSPKKRVRVILAMAIYEMVFLDKKIPIAINEAVKLAKQVSKAEAGFVNAVLRSFARSGISMADVKSESLEIRHSFPTEIIDIFRKEVAGEEELSKLLESSNDIPPISLRVRPEFRNDKDTLRALEDFSYRNGNISKNGIYILKGGIIESSLFKTGIVSIQDEASIFAVEKFFKEDMRLVIDLCAAPGGKSLAVAELMKYEEDKANKDNYSAIRSKVLAFDIYEHKADLIKNAIKRTGLNNVEAIVEDSSILKEELFSVADGVIVDGPCSGLGVIRRRPEIKYKKHDYKSLIALQEKLLYNGSRYVKKGGRLMYTTCTINYEENERQIQNFLAHMNDVGEKWDKIYERQMLPHLDKTDGFYICILERR